MGGSGHSIPPKQILRMVNALQKCAMKLSRKVRIQNTESLSDRRSPRFETRQPSSLLAEPLCLGKDMNLDVGVPSDKLVVCDVNACLKEARRSEFPVRGTRDFESTNRIILADRPN